MVNVTTLVRYICSVENLYAYWVFHFLSQFFWEIKEDLPKIHKRNEIEYTFENINIRYDTHDYEIYIGYVAVYIRTVLHIYFKEFEFSVSLSI